ASDCPTPTAAVVRGLLQVSAAWFCLLYTGLLWQKLCPDNINRNAGKVHAAIGISIAVFKSLAMCQRFIGIFAAFNSRLGLLLAAEQLAQLPWASTQK